MAEERPDEPIGTLVREAIGHAKALAGAEWRLFRAELREGAEGAKRGGAMLALSAVLGLGAGLMALLTLAALLAAIGLPVWLAALLTTVLAGAGAALLGRAGVRELTRHPVPERTMEQLQRDRAMVQERMR